MSSFARDLYLYARDRIATRRIAVLLAFLSALSLIADPRAEWRDLTVRILALAILVVQFRLWDDLMDRDYDRIHHPERLLARHPDLWPFQLLSMLSLIVSGTLIGWQFGERGLIAYVALLCLLLLVYIGPFQLLRRLPVRSQLVLIKYPTFLAIIAPCALCPRLVVVAMLAYGVLTVHEWIDDRALREEL